MSISNAGIVQKPRELIAKLANEKDQSGIEALRSSCRLTPSKWPDASTPDNAFDRPAAEDQTLVAVLPRTGQIVAATTLGFVANAHGLNERMGRVMNVSAKLLPAITMTHSLVKDGGSGLMALRLEILKAASRMRHPVGGQIQSLMGLDILPDPFYGVFSLVRLGYTLETPDEETVLFSEDTVFSRLPLARFVQAKSMLEKDLAAGHIPSYEWQGPAIMAR